jgi:hypothetical protein
VLDSGTGWGRVLDADSGREGLLDAGHAQAGQDLGGRLGVGGPHLDALGAGAAELGQRPLEDQLPGPHHADMRADLLDLGEQVRGHEHGDAVRRDGADQRAHLASALRVKAVGRLIEYHQLPRLQQRRGDRQPLLHPERVVPELLLRRAGQPDPVQRRRDAGRSRLRVGRPVGGVVPEEVVPAVQVPVKGRAFDQ